MLDHRQAAAIYRRNAGLRRLRTLTRTLVVVAAALAGAFAALAAQTTFGRKHVVSGTRPPVASVARASAPVSRAEHRTTRVPPPPPLPPLFAASQVSPDRSPTPTEHQTAPTPAPPATPPAPAPPTAQPVVVSGGS